jgi:rare lipoprotein A
MKFNKFPGVAVWAILATCAIFIGCASNIPNQSEQIGEQSVFEAPQTVASVELGKASYYADKFQGKSTASGELYDRNKLTAAHPKLPFGTQCRVTNLANGRTVVVRINDRGPFSKTRIIDLSYRAADQLDGIRAGVFDVKVEVLR